MYNRVMSFLSSKNILYEPQYGFRTKHSTIHPIIHLINQSAKVNNAIRIIPELNAITLLKLRHE